MSRIGKKPIKIPEGVSVKVSDEKVQIKGPKGELSFVIRPEISVKIEGEQIVVEPKFRVKNINAYWGLTRSLINNAVIGVSYGYKKQLEIQGVGYRAELKDKKLILKVGFSHLVEYDIPQDINVSVEKNIITVSGIDKQKVGEIAAQIRRIKPPDPYKGKGIRYVGEEIILKEGKKAVGSK